MKFLRMTVLTVVLLAQLFSGINIGVSAETANQEVGEGSYNVTEDEAISSPSSNLQTMQVQTEEIPTTTEATIKIVGLTEENPIETKVAIQDGSTALTLLKDAATVRTEDSTWGPMIKAINGLEAADPYYWGFYINGNYAEVGAAEYHPQANDIITFKYESWEKVDNEVTIEIVGEKTTIWKQPIRESSTAFTLLDTVADVVAPQTEWGPMITDINGLPAAGTYYWAFYVNGKMAPTGAGSYIPSANEILTFKYESWEQPGTSPEEDSPVDEPTDGLPAGSLEGQLEQTSQWIQNKGVSSPWEAVVLRQLGKAISNTYFQSLEKRILDNNGQFTNVTDYETAVIGLVSGSKDPTNFHSYNLIEKIYNNSRMTAQGLNGVVYGLLALDSNHFEIPENATWNREKLVSYILESQHDDGGWSLTGSTSDVDMTAMALTALAPYKDQADVTNAINNAINWLTTRQLTNGGFIGKYGENLETAATVLTALTALGIDPIEKLTNGNIIDYLGTYILADGSFEHEQGNNVSNNFATEQGLLALVSYARFLDEKGSVYDLSNLPPLVLDETGGNDQVGPSPALPEVIKKQLITISVKSHESTILSSRSLEVSEDATALSALVDALEESGIAFETSGSGSSGYVISINGLAEFDKGPTSGWKYSVNGYFPSTGAGTYRLSDGDQLEWVYEIEGLTPGPVNTIPSKPEGVSIQVFESLAALKGDSKKLNAILNKDAKMSTETAQKIKEMFAANTVQLEKTVIPTEETVIAHPEIDEAKIIIPKEALPEQKTIKIEELTPAASSMGGYTKSSIYQFSPKGTKFEKPVYISINIPIENDDLENLVMAWLDEEKNQWIPIPTVIDAKTGTITGLIDHFTKFAVIDRAAQNKLNVSKEMENLIDYLQADQNQSEWEDFGLGRLNVSNKQAVLTAISEKLKEVNGSFRKITDYERYTLTIKALGGDPTNFAGYNLIEKIYNNDRMTSQGTNGLIFALIALDSGNYQVPNNAKWNREKILAQILANQNNDGGFSLVSGGTSDVDITAMAVSSMAAYQNDQKISKSIEKAITWLSNVQQASGGFIADGKENSESAAQVIIALTAMGIDPQGEKFTKADGNVISNLLSYQNKDGGFSNLKNEVSNQIASEQALLALITLDRFSKKQSSIYQFTDQHESVETGLSVPAFADGKDISAYALQSVYKAFDKGIMYGVEKHPLRFAPQQPLTRAQFTAILVKLLEGAPYEQNNVVFEDVKPGQWYYGVIMRAQQLGIVSGTSKTTFSPNDPVTREQVAIILVRAFQLVPEQIEAKPLIYRDIVNLSNYNQAAIQALYDHNLMKGYEGGLFKPNDLVTREMGAALSVRIDEKYKIRQTPK